MTLVETIVAIFVLTLGIAFVGGMMRVGLHHQAHSQRRMLAVALARKKMTLLRAWARTVVAAPAYRYDDSSASWMAQVTTPDPAYLNFAVKCKVQDQLLYSPCASMEAPYVPLGTARTMHKSAKIVKISVADPEDPGWTADIISLICDPTRDLKSPPDQAVHLIPTSAIPTFLSPSGADLKNPAVDSYVDMRAEAVYQDGSKVADIFFDWYVIPLGGTGSLITARDGRTCRFVNGVSTGLNVVTTEGNAVVAVHGSYRGQGQPPQNYDIGTGNPYIDRSPVFPLGPPPP